MSDDHAMDKPRSFHRRAALVAVAAVGTVSEAVIAALVQQERRDGPPPVCGA